VAHLKGSAQWVLEVDAIGCVLHHKFDIYICIFMCMPKNIECVCVCVFLSEAVSDIICCQENVTVVC
jgi:hypothetical protein